MSFGIYETVTNRIIAELEAGAQAAATASRHVVIAAARSPRCD